MRADYVLVKLESAFAETRFDVGLVRANGVDVESAVNAPRDSFERLCLNSVIFDAMALGYWLERLDGDDRLGNADAVNAFIALCRDVAGDRDAQLARATEAWRLLTSPETDAMARTVRLRLHPPA